MSRNLSLASRLRRRIVIERPVLSPDGAGGFTTSWVKYAAIWAEVAPRSGNERLANEQLAAFKNLVVTIRYLAGVNETMRIRFGVRVFNITAILNPYEENVLLEITAVEGVE